jgi:hypothetical protein
MKNIAKFLIIIFFFFLGNFLAKRENLELFAPRLIIVEE